MSILLLPPELKLNIIEHTDPESTFQFALTSRDHFQLCRDLLQEHAKLFAQYSIIDASNPGPVLWDTLKTILQDPRKAWYVRDLSLPNTRQERWEGDFSEDELDLYKAAVEELVPIYSYEPTFFAVEQENDGRGKLEEDDLNELIEAGVDDPIIILLIHNLPRLKTFRMTVGYRGVDLFETFARRVAAGYQDPALAPRMPLKHLKNVAVAHHDSEFCCSVDWAVYFLCIPSVRLFTALSMGSEGIAEYDGENSEAHLRTVTNTPVSNVEEICFTHCQFDVRSFETILPLVKNLKKFTYEAGGAIVAYQDYEARRVIQALATHVGHSLEQLFLEESDIGMEECENDLLIVSLRDFEKLKILQCETRWLLRSTDTDLGSDEELSQGFYSIEDAGPAISDPRDNLPVSLEELHLDGVYEDEEWEDLVSIFEKPNANTPNLTMNKVCVRRQSAAWNAGDIQTKFGGAAAPQGEYVDRFTTKLLYGHGYA